MTTYLPRSDPGPVDRVATENDMPSGNELCCVGQMRRNPWCATCGTAGHYETVDEMLTGRENLQLVGRLYHLGRAERRQRPGRVLEQVQLADPADRPVRTYSGGMRRRPCPRTWSQGAAPE